MQEIYQALGRAAWMGTKLKFLLASVTEESQDPVGGDGDGYRNPRFGLKGSMGGEFTYIYTRYAQFYAEFLY